MIKGLRAIKILGNQPFFLFLGLKIPQDLALCKSFLVPGIFEKTVSDFT
jgi:hypothetical protein